MELFAAVALLWRHRVLVLLGLLLALGAGYKLMGGTTTNFGTAQTRVVLDTTTSQLLDVEPPGADTLPARAIVLADLAQTRELEARIADAARVDPKDLVILAPHLGEATAKTVLPVSSLDAAASVTVPYVLAIQALSQLPIIAIEASGPRSEDAVRLVTAAVKALKAEAEAHKGEPSTQPFVVNEMAPIRTKAVESGPRRTLAAAAALIAFGCWCFGVMLIASVVRALRLGRSMTRNVAGGF